MRLPWLASKHVQRYIIIGLLVYGFELLVIILAQQAGAGNLLAVGLSFWLGLLLSFGLQKIITFGDKRLHHKILITQFIAVCLLVLFNFGFTLLLTAALDGRLSAVLCRTLALGITTIWNFYIYKTYIFKTSPSRPSKKRAKSTKSKSLSARIKKWHSRHYRALLKRPIMKRLNRLGKKPKFAKRYLLACLLILFVTSIFWSIMGAQVHQANADQLVNAYLMQDWSTFRGAALPDQHSFFVKWPLFLLVKLFGFSTASFIAMTVLTVLVTIAGLVYILSRIERRPVVLGTICLGLSSVLLLVPTQPYAGGLLPVNMAMLTTRNLEYLLYIAALYCLIKAPKLVSKYSLVAVLLFSVLIASDKLFMSLSLLGAGLAIICYILRQRWTLVSLSSRWLLVGASGVLGASAIVSLINHSNLTNIVSLSSIGPYGLTHGLGNVLLACAYAVGGILTNFGANPAYDALSLQAIPSQLIDNMLSVGGLAYIVNFGVMLIGLCAGYMMLLRSLGLIKQPKFAFSLKNKLAVMMIWSVVAVTILFVATHHYYVVDARYLTLSLFALFVVLSVWSSEKRLRPELWLTAAPILVVSIACGMLASISASHNQTQVSDPLVRRNQIIVQTLASHKVDALVGDYWRILPVKALNNKQTVSPLAGCTDERQILTSDRWQPDLRRHSFAYLLTLEGSLTDYPNCSLAQIEKIYGVPNSSALIDGTLDHPKEKLLFYDRGISISRKTTASEPKTSTVLPIDLAGLTNADCSAPTIMNVVAHQDDDLLFMNPDLFKDIKAGRCVRSVYLTAGDAGEYAPYWLSREKGSEAAYSLMSGTKSIWIQKIVKLPGGQFVTIDSPKGNNSISLIFMHLPDGNLRGEGFGTSHHESLDALEAGRIASVDSVDNQSSYTQDQLTQALVDLLRAYQPVELRTQSTLDGSRYNDHSDHMATGRIAAKALSQYEAQLPGEHLVAPLKYYVGYPVRQSPANITQREFRNKEAIFMAYAAFDSSVCHSVGQCRQTSTYGSYLRRQYTSPN